jgi:hypothetical protein
MLLGGVGVSRFAQALLFCNLLIQRRLDFRTQLGEAVADLGAENMSKVRLQSGRSQAVLRGSVPGSCTEETLLSCLQIKRVPVLASTVSDEKPSFAEMPRVTQRVIGGNINDLSATLEKSHNLFGETYLFRRVRLILNHVTLGKDSHKTLLVRNIFRSQFESVLTVKVCRRVQNTTISLLALPKFRGWVNLHDNVVRILHVLDDHCFDLEWILFVDLDRVREGSRKIQNAEIGAVWPGQLNLEDFRGKVLGTSTCSWGDAHAIRDLLLLGTFR